MFLEIAQNSQENTRAGVSFLINLSAFDDSLGFALKWLNSSN